jgi:hypothetical protein
MATTEILQFASSGGANVVTQAQYAALTSILANGYSAGTALSAQLNKTWRQSSFMAAGLANWMVARGISVPDDGNLVNLVAEIQAALNAYIDKSVAGGVDVTLNPLTEANFPILDLTGLLTANINVIVPSAAGAWIFRNSTTGAYSITVKTAAGTGVVVPQGSSSDIYSDAVNCYQVGGAYAVQDRTVIAAGTADAITVAPSPAILQFDNGPLWWKASAANATSTPTLQRSALAAKTIVKGSNSPLSAGDIPGPTWMCSVYDAVLDKEVLLTPATGISLISSKLPSFLATAAANALTGTLGAETLDFRSATLTSGAPVTRTAATAQALVVPSGATLGSTNAIASRLIWGWLDNAGTLEPFVTNQAGDLNLDETTLISTTAMSGASNTANVIYSASARTNVAFRIRGFCDITEATAGTWATQPTLVQPVGGMAVIALEASQKWVDVTGSRALGTTYYNTNGKKIQVCISTIGTVNGSSTALQVYVSGGVVATQGWIYGAGGVGAGPCVTLDIPPGASYSASTSQGSLTSWWEEK